MNAQTRPHQGWPSRWNPSVRTAVDTYLAHALAIAPALTETQRAALRPLLTPIAETGPWSGSTGPAPRAARSIRASDRAELLIHPCAYCGATAQVIDHVVPVAGGGGPERLNLVPACKRCNDDKLDLTFAQWREYRLQVGLSWPPRREDTSHV